MEEIPLIRDIVVIFGLSIVVLLICHRIRIPSIVGFLFTGILCGPHGLKLVGGEADVSNLATIGIVLLLFTVGMEFSFKKIIESRNYFLIGGTLQVFLSVLAGWGIAELLGSSFGESLFFGFLLSLSSTAIVLRILDEKRESDSPHGKCILGMMIFQDVVAIPMMLSIPLLGGVNQEFDYALLYSFIKGVVLLGIVIVCGAMFVPRLLYMIAKTRNRELFLMSVIAICSSVAFFTSSIGLSLSLGAFLAGLIISDSEYRTEAIGDILPFQGIFTSFFFVSIGMLLDLEFFFSQPFFILAIAAGVILLKATLAGAATLVLGMPLRTVVITGLAMSQVGEFSFVLAKAGHPFGLGDDYHYQLFLSVALLTMAITPTLIQFSPFIAERLLRLPLPVRLKSGLKPAVQKSQPKNKDHVIIVGYGISGRNLAHSNREAGIPYIILEMNAETVKQEKKKGEPIYFGDASHEAVLHHCNIDEAKVLAVVINDPIAAARIVEVARKLNNDLYIIVRTRYLREMKLMYHLGADEVIPDEFGSSVEILTRVLRKFQVPGEDMERLIAEMRVEGYEMLRLLYREPTTLSDLQATLSGVLVETYRVNEGALIAGKTLAEVDLRKNYNVTAMMITRDKQNLTNLDAQSLILANDVLVVVGTHDNLSKAKHLFKAHPREETHEGTTDHYAAK